MAILGRLTCSLCGFEGAHVKQNPHKLPYQHCPDCGAMLSTKSKHQARLLLDKMRPVSPDEIKPAPAAVEIEHPAPAVVATRPPPPPVRQTKPSFWTQMAGKS